MSWGAKYPSMPQNKLLTVSDVLNSPQFAPAVMGAVNNPALRSSLVGKSVPWSAVDLPLVTALPPSPDDRAEVNYLIDTTNEVVVRMIYRKATGNWVQVGAVPTVTALPPTTTAGLQVVYDTGTAGVRWQLVYDASDGTTYPWLYIGGTALLDQVDTPETTASTTYTVLSTAGPAITLPLAGIYRVTGKVMHSNATANVLDYMSFDIGGTGAADIDAARGISDTSAGNVYVERTRDYTVSANTTLTAKYRTGSSTATFERRLLTATPVRVV